MEQQQAASISEDELVKSVKDILSKTEDLSTLTVNKVFTALQEQYKVDLTDKKQFIKTKLMELLTSQNEEENQESKDANESVEEQPAVEMKDEEEQQDVKEEEEEEKMDTKEEESDIEKEAEALGSTLR